MYLYQLIDNLDLASKTTHKLISLNKKQKKPAIESIQKACLEYKLRRNIDILLSADDPQKLQGNERPQLEGIRGFSQNNIPHFTAIIESIFKGESVRIPTQQHGNYPDRIITFITGDLYKSHQSAQAENGCHGIVPQYQAELMNRVSEEIAKITKLDNKIGQALDAVIKKAKRNVAVNRALGEHKNIQVLTNVLNQTYQYKEKGKILASTIRLKFGDDVITLEQMLHTASQQRTPWKAIFKTLAYFRFINLGFPENVRQTFLIDNYEKHLVSVATEAFYSIPGTETYLDDIQPFRFYGLYQNLRDDLLKLQQSLVNDENIMLKDRDMNPHQFIGEIVNDIQNLSKFYSMNDELKDEFKNRNNLFNVLDDKLRDFTLTRLAALHRSLSNYILDNRMKPNTYKEIVKIIKKYEQEIVAMRSPKVKSTIAPTVEVNTVKMICQDIVEIGSGHFDDRNARDIVSMANGIGEKLPRLLVQEITLDRYSAVPDNIFWKLKKLFFKLLEDKHGRKNSAKIFSKQFTDLELLAKNNSIFALIWSEAQDAFYCERWENRYQKRSANYTNSILKFSKHNLEEAEQLRKDINSLRNGLYLHEFHRDAVTGADGVQEPQELLLKKIAQSESRQEYAVLHDKFVRSSEIYNELLQKVNVAYMAWRQEEDIDEKKQKRIAYDNACGNKNDYAKRQDGFEQIKQEQYPLTEATRRQAIELRIIVEAMEISGSKQSYNGGYAQILETLLSKMAKEPNVSSETRLRLVICRFVQDFQLYRHGKKGWSNPPEDKVARLGFIAYGEHPEDNGAQHIDGLADMFDYINTFYQNGVDQPLEFDSVSRVSNRVIDFLLEQYQVLYYHDKQHDGKRARHIVEAALDTLKEFVTPEQKNRIKVGKKEIQEKYENKVPLGDYPGPQLNAVAINDLRP